MTIRYARDSVCAQDDYVNHEIKIELPGDATVKDLVDYLARYHDDNDYSAIPYTGGNAHWMIATADDRQLAEVKDDGNVVSYCGNDPMTKLQTLNIEALKGSRL